MIGTACGSPISCGRQNFLTIVTEALEHMGKDDQDLAFESALDPGIKQKGPTMSGVWLLCVVKTFPDQRPLKCTFTDVKGYSCLPVPYTIRTKPKNFPSLSRIRLK